MKIIACIKQVPDSEAKVKAEGGKVKFVLPTKIGEVVVTKEWEEEHLRELLESDI